MTTATKIMLPDNSSDANHDHGLTTMDENAQLVTDKIDVFGERGARVMVGQTYPRGKEYQT